jgi:hypothetical protein
MCRAIEYRTLRVFFITKLSVYVDTIHTYCACCNTVLRIRTRDPVPFDPWILRDPSDSGSQTHIFESLVTIS